MKFAKDILMIDFEGYVSPIQIGAILLDKETLEEKDTFTSLIYADLTGRKPSISGITQDMLVGAPSEAEVGKTLYEKFGTDVIISSFASDLDFRHIRTLMTSAGIDPKVYDYHILDVWPLAYVHLVKQGYTGGIRSEEIFQAFGAKPRGAHDALEDCRITAEVLRKIVNADLHN